MFGTCLRESEWVKHPANRRMGEFAPSKTRCAYVKVFFLFTDNVDTICLPDSDVNFDNDRCIVAGWGALSGVNYHEVRYLKQVELSMVPQNACSKSLRKTSRRRKKFGLQKSFICADGAGKEHINICKEDSGAPLFCPIPGQLSRYQQVGIVSKGIGCRNIGVPAMFTNVPLFRKWIDQQMKLHSLEQNTYDI